MSWSIASLAGLRCRTRRKELLLQESRFAVRPWTSFLLRLPVKFVFILSALLHGSPRKQRKWLARFRKPWWAKLGVLRPRDDVPLALQKLKAAQSPKPKTFINILRQVWKITTPDLFFGPQYRKALLLDMVPRPRFWGRLVAPISGPSLLRCRLRRISSGSMLQWMRRRSHDPLFSSIWTKLPFWGMSVACVAQLSKPLRRCKWLDRASLSARRSSVSLLACISSDVGIQADLPQVLIGNEHTFTLQVLRPVGSRVGNAILWRQKSAWNAQVADILNKTVWGLWSQRDMWSFLLMFTHPTLMVRSFSMPAGAVWGWFTSQQSLLPICNLVTPMSLPCWSRLCGKVGWRKKQNRKRAWFARSPGWSLFAMQ